MFRSSRRLRRPRLGLPSLESLEDRRVPASFVLNEVSVNPPSTDEPFEYIEIKGTPGALLSNIYAVGIDGDAPDTGLVDVVVDLTGKQIGINGMLIIKAVEGGHLPPAATTTVLDGNFDRRNGILENNSNSFALIRSDTPIAMNSDLDVDDDGVLDLSADAVMVDAIGWLDGSSSADRAYGAVLSQSQSWPDAATRLRHATAPLAADQWFNADLTGESVASKTYDATRASANFPTGAVLTPGDHNYQATPSNAAPIARDEAFTMLVGTTLDIPEASGLLRNPGELDADGDFLGVINVSASLPPLHTLTVNADGWLSYTPAPEYSGEVSFTYQVADGAATSAMATVTIQVREPNSPPTITVSDEPQTFTENGAAKLIFADALLTDDSPTFAGGSLMAAIAAGIDASSDRLGILSTGDGPGQIGVVGTDVRYGGISLGSIDTGGVGRNPLTVTFNGGASVDAVEALIRSITFFTFGDAPSTEPRSVELQVSDGEAPEGAASNVVETIVNVVAVNDRPALALGGSRGYFENQPAVQLTRTGVANDVDDADFGGGSLTVSLAAGGEASDELSILAIGGIALATENKVLLDGVEIGAYVGGYATGQPLVVSLNTSADASAVTALVRSIGYRSTSENPAAGPHVVSFVLNDGEANSLPRTRTVNVTPVNDRPIIMRGGGTVGYRRNSAPVTLLPSALVVEDQPHFAGGRLRVTSTGAQPGDRLLLQGGFNVNRETSEVFLGTIAAGTHIGTVNNGGIGGNELVVTFNANATRAIVERLLRSIRFRTAGAHPSLVGLRTIHFTLTDTLGLEGNTAVRRVNVV